MGVIIGYLNVLYLRPAFFSLDQNGLFILIPAHAMMISPFCSLGMGSSFIKYFPSFEGSFKNQLFTFQLLIVVFANILLIAGWHVFKDWIASYYVESAPEYVNYLSITAIVIVVNSLFDLFFSYSKTLLKVVFPSFLRDIFLKLGSAVLVIGYAVNWYSFEWAINGLAINYSLAFILLYLQLATKHGLRFTFNFSNITITWKKKIFKFSIYSMLMAGSFAILNNVTYSQITSYLGAAANGIFTTCFFIGIIVEMPRKNMAKVVVPIISSAFDKNDMTQIETIYKKGSITMSVIGYLLFIGIITNLHDLFNLIPKGDQFRTGYSVVLGVCITKLVLMIASFSGEIISFSRFYKYNLLFQVLAAVLLVFLNYFIILKWGLDGVAISYTSVIIVHIIIKLIYVNISLGYTLSWNST